MIDPPSERNDKTFPHSVYQKKSLGSSLFLRFSPLKYRKRGAESLYVPKNITLLFGENRWAQRLSGRDGRYGS
jgi:hypothetical protein